MYQRIGTALTKCLMGSFHLCGQVEIFPISLMCLFPCGLCNYTFDCILLNGRLIGKDVKMVTD
jgi:hypothetical protein